jgi:hypothetical protein
MGNKGNYPGTKKNRAAHFGWLQSPTHSNRKELADCGFIEPGAYPVAITLEQRPDKKIEVGEHRVISKWRAVIIIMKQISLNITQRRSVYPGILRYGRSFLMTGTTICFPNT